MRQDLTISRRKAVTLVAGSLAVSAAPVATQDVAPAHAAATARPADAVTLLAESHRRMFELLQRVRRAHGATARGEAFGRFTTALRMHRVAEASLHATSANGSLTSPEGGLTALYRQPDPSGLLANVIARELETLSQGDVAWMMRFADLEAVIHAHGPQHRRSDAYGPATTA